VAVVVVVGPVKMVNLAAQVAVAHLTLVVLDKERNNQAAAASVGDSQAVVEQAIPTVIKDIQAPQVAAAQVVLVVTELLTDGNKAVNMVAPVVLDEHVL
jgi:hypothetical protein